MTSHSTDRMDEDITPWEETDMNQDINAMAAEIEAYQAKKRLQDAAPALLAALQALTEIVRANPHLSGERLARVAEMKDAEAAIRHAKGESA